MYWAHIYIYGFLFVESWVTQAESLQKLREKYANDPDALFGPWGVKFIGPRGVEEDEPTHLARLAHNARMRFNRSFVSGMGPKKCLLMDGSKKMFVNTWFYNV